MGSFSWFASDTNRAILMNNPFPVYALRPGTEPLLETEYEGYGRFGGVDIYDLIGDWNRQFLAENPDFVVVQRISKWSEEAQAYLPVPDKAVSEFEWYPLYADLNNSPQDIEREMRKSHRYWDYRFIGIDIACYDDQNFNLPYPIKLVERPVPYEEALPSYSDPDQGFGEKDRFHNQVERLIVKAEKKSAPVNGNNEVAFEVEM